RRARHAVLQSARYPPEPAELPVAGSRDQFRRIVRCLPVGGSPEHHDASGDFAQERQYHLEGIPGGYWWHLVPAEQRQWLCHQARSVRLLRRRDKFTEFHF